MLKHQHFGSSKFAKAIVLMAIAATVAIWNPEPLSGFLRGALHTVAWPIEKGFAFLSFEFSEIGSFLSSISDLKSENARLKKENIRLSGENASLVFLRGENDALRRDAGLSLRRQFDVFAGETIAVSGEAQRGILVVDRGSMQGVSVGMPVVVGEGVLIGFVEEVYPASANVLLLTHSKSAIGGVTLEGETKGIVRGERGVGMLFDMALEKESLRSGDRVVTTGTNGIPAGLLVGTIENVHISSDRLFRQASVVSPISMNDIRFVFFVR